MSYIFGEKVPSALSRQNAARAREAGKVAKAESDAAEATTRANSDKRYQAFRANGDALAEMHRTARLLADAKRQHSGAEADMSYYMGHGGVDASEFARHRAKITAAHDIVELVSRQHEAAKAAAAVTAADLAHWDAVMRMPVEEEPAPPQPEPTTPPAAAAKKTAPKKAAR